MLRTVVERVPPAPAIAVAICLLAVEFFLRDWGLSNLESWGLAGIIVVGVAACLALLPRGGWARALLWLVATPAAGFLILYDVTDAILDPFVSADWPIALFSALLIIAIELVLLATLWEDE